MEVKVNGPKLVRKGEGQYDYVSHPPSETRANEFDDLWEDLDEIRDATLDDDLYEYVSSWMQVTETRAHLLRTRHDWHDVLTWIDNETGIVKEEATMVRLHDTWREKC